MKAISHLPRALIARRTSTPNDAVSVIAAHSAPCGIGKWEVGKGPPRRSVFCPSFRRFDKCWGYSRYFPLAPPTDRHHRAQGLFGAKITRRQPRGDHFAKTRASSTPRRSAIKVRVACPKGSIRAVTDHLSVVNQPIPSPMSLQESDDSSGIVSRRPFRV